ncbi:ACH96210.1 GrBNV gp60-like protein [Kallithea virus]|uniref:ACH96210.1 GrBNV gp60-like protein n=1 Tax=Kallithea virus TaxID=1654582 RepID=A0A0F7KLP1_9VIRU|nr:ACH96210.1 GrBNV gp60-like protein [Kallithea virus]AKH40381.1 putative gp60-like protein [Kallithea virus]AQN78607.1 ACH96210.1 GrBNV gp60-like protein [Kallithea virus]
MSVSLDSYESVVKMTCEYYDSEMPLYFNEGHYNIACDIIALLLQKQEFSIVRTNLKLLEPIMENGGVIYMSLPLIALLVNSLVDLPQNSVEFVNNFNIFDGLNMITEDRSSQRSCYAKANRRPSSMSSVIVRNQNVQNYNKIVSSAIGKNVYNIEPIDDSNNIQQFSPTETIRFTQTLRIVLMCAHFYQHYIGNIPYNDHSTFQALEIAHRPIMHEK